MEKPSTSSTHRRPAWMAVSENHSKSEPILIQTDSNQVDITSLKPVAYAFERTPVIVVPKDYVDAVCESFTSGMYGFDTESDVQTRELRIIQVFDGKKVYIFGANDALMKVRDNQFVKFLKSKDRIKIGVDIETDILRISTHVKQNCAYPKNHALKFTVNGVIDLQSIARTVGETIFGLEKLASKYVPDFKGNPSNLGSYNPPTIDQYIYAANDAILSLKIFKPLMGRTQISDEAGEIFEQYIEMLAGPVPMLINHWLQHLIKNHEPWKSLPLEKKHVKAFKITAEMASRGLLTRFDVDKGYLWVSNKTFPIIQETNVIESKEVIERRNAIIAENLDVLRSLHDIAQSRKFSKKNSIVKKFASSNTQTKFPEKVLLESLQHIETTESLMTEEKYWKIFDDYIQLRAAGHNLNLELTFEQFIGTVTPSVKKVFPEANRSQTSLLANVFTSYCIENKHIDVLANKNLKFASKKA